MAKILYRKDTGEILGVHIIGLHAADLIHEVCGAGEEEERSSEYLVYREQGNWTAL